MGLILFALINSNIGFLKIAASPVCTVGLAVVCTFLPMIVMVMAATVLVLLHFYAVSLPIAIVAAVIFLLMYIFYFRFTPRKAWIVLLSAMAFGLKVPFIIPVVFGLLGTPIWIVPSSCGIAAFYIVDYVKGSATALKSVDSESLATSLISSTKQILTGKEMWLMIIAVAVGILVVHIVRTRSINHAWKVASASGAAVSLVIAAAGNIAMKGDLSYVVMAVSAVLGAALGLVLEFLFFCVDYSRTENIQFEDDEYYYYVKAVPKVGVAVPEKQVKHITEEPAEKEVKKQKKTKVAEGENTDDILLTRSLSKELGLEKERPE